ncbi:MAG: hypothetical protein NXH75_15565 [Halobacteriovoraceae bacterium]|nr:hypothetical protein [Halobacteriovoraceae bacterium]
MALVLILSSGCSLLEKMKQPFTPKNAQTTSGNAYGDKLRKRLLENVPNLRFCLEKFLPLTESGDFKGSVTFSFAVNRFGMVRNVSVTSDQLRNIKAKGCMVKTITTIEMPNHTSKKDFKMRQPIGITMR